MLFRSNQIFADIVTGKYPGIMQLAWGFTDVRDVANAHIRAMETAFRMQFAAGDVFDIRSETQATHEEYGSSSFARGCLISRRLVERGVRYIQVSTNYTWDHHQKVKDGSITESAKVDRPIAGLLAADRPHTEDLPKMFIGDVGSGKAIALRKSVIKAANKSTETK